VSSDQDPTFQTVIARSISQVIANALHEAPFHGQVLSCFPAVCNLADEAGRVVCLVTAGVGDGPLNVVLEGPEPFAGIEKGVEAHITPVWATVGDRLTVDLEDAALWEPVVTWGDVAAEALAALWRYVQEQATPESLLTFWLPQIRLLGGVRMAFHETARDAAERLLLALRRGDQPGIRLYASALAGLGPGNTPAGDDFLLGLMAGLRAWPPFLAAGGLAAELACAVIGQAAVTHTRVLSAAHLRAARAGQMGVGWHRLAAVLVANDAAAIEQAAGRLLAVGATSGADALAGFLGPYLLTASDGD